MTHKKESIHLDINNNPSNRIQALILNNDLQMIDKLLLTVSQNERIRFQDGKLEF